MNHRIVFASSLVSTPCATTVRLKLLLMEMIASVRVSSFEYHAASSEQRSQSKSVSTATAAATSSRVDKPLQPLF